MNGRCTPRRYSAACGGDRKESLPLEGAGHIGSENRIFCYVSCWSSVMCQILRWWSSHVAIENYVHHCCLGNIHVLFLNNIYKRVRQAIIGWVARQYSRCWRLPPSRTYTLAKAGKAFSLLQSVTHFHEPFCGLSENKQSFKKAFG